MQLLNGKKQPSSCKTQKKQRADNEQQLLKFSNYITEKNNPEVVKHNRTSAEAMNKSCLNAVITSSLQLRNAIEPARRP